MREGRIDYNALNRCSLSVDELMSHARKRGYFNLADIDCAVLETDGSVSVLPRPQKRGLNPKDFNFAPIREGISYAVFENGVLYPDRLNCVGFTEKRLADFLNEHNYNIADLSLITVNEAGRVDVFY